MSTRSALRVVPHDAGVDLAAAESAAAQFLTALGVSLDSESTRGTPARMRAPTPSCSPPARSS